ncbi:MAG: tight adherence protein [Actinomycetota bacterium]|nr:tight adherence protein [Actinomycetota bacterium]
MAAVVGWSWAAMAAAVVLRLRPLPTRRLPASPRTRTSLAERVGSLVLRRAGHADPPAARCRQVGFALLAAGTVLPLRPLAAVPAAAAAWALPGVRDKRRVRARQAAIDASLPEVVDLLVLATGAGLSIRQAVAAVAARAEGPLAAVLQRAVTEADHGRRLADALDDVALRAGESTRPVLGILLASERYGAPVGPALDRLAGEVRADARRRAEAAARRVPVKLLFPLVVCILPAFGLLTVAPLIASAIRSLRL